MKFYEPDASGREKYIDYNRVLNILRGVHYNGFLGIVYEGERRGDTGHPAVCTFHAAGDVGVKS